MKNLILIFFLFQISIWSISAQNTIAHNDTLAQHHQTETLHGAFKNGHFQGYFRTFFMATDNAKQLTDYNALAAGGGLSFQTAPFHRFSFGIGGVFNYNLHSSDLGSKDSLTGASNRYEIGLFDIEDPYNCKDLNRMEAFWLRYERPK